MDTYTSHFLVRHKNLEENVTPQLTPLFKALFTKNFETGSSKNIWYLCRGRLSTYECGEYFAEKCYRLYNKSDNIYLTHMKGLNATFKKNTMKKL